MDDVKNVKIELEQLDAVIREKFNTSNHTLLGRPVDPSVYEIHRELPTEVKNLKIKTLKNFKTSAEWVLSDPEVYSIFCRIKKIFLGD